MKRLTFQTWPTGFRWVTMLAAWLALTVYFFQPASHVLDGDLDPSIFTAYAYYTAHGFQFGPQVVAMGGPYAFIMYGEFYGGDLFGLRTVCELVVQGIFSSLVLWLFSRQSSKSWIRWLWILAHLVFTPTIGDLSIAWTMLLVGFFLLETPASSRTGRWPVLGAVLLGWLALFKGTHLILSFATIGIVAAAWVLQRNWRHASRLLGSYLVSVLLFWLLARQNPLNLPAYISGTLHLTQSYNGAMAVEEPWHIFRRGAAVTGGLILALGVTAWFRRRDLLQVAALTLLAGYTFAMWKHGFVRADGHVIIFFCFAAVSTLTWYLCFLNRDDRSSLFPRLGAQLVATALLLLCIAGPSDPLRPNLAALWDTQWPSLRGHIHYLTHLSAERSAIEQRLEAQRDFNAMPDVKAVVGQASIDLYGFQQGIIPLNRFNYTPRPMGAGTFNVYDSFLMKLNRDFMRDPARRPDFFLLNLASIDNRFVTQDDGLALQELLYGYRPEFIEQNFLLMRAVPDAQAPAARLVSRQTFKFGEPVNVPTVSANEILLARFVISENWRGKLRSTLYKPRELQMVLQDHNRAELGSRRLVPSMAVSPFIFSPWMEHTADILGVYDTQQGTVLGSFIVTSSEPQLYTSNLAVEFLAVSRPPVMNAHLLTALRERARFPLANLAPDSITPTFKPHNIVRYLHAPSEIVWSLTGKERELIFNYGIDPRAYEEGTTNGVEFIVEVRGPSGGVKRAFSRLLQPLGKPADQGRHLALVELPIYAPGSRLVLRTDPGPYGDTAWDWAYATHINIQSGRYTKEQFPGFNRLPDQAECENAAVVEIAREKALLLHVPGMVRFSLTGREKQVELSFGFLPGAYSGEGRTSGADYTVELLRSGRSPEELFRRALRPVSKPSDRGQQSAEISLPSDIVANDILVLKTLAAPGGNNSWGWTYLSRVTID